MTELSFVEVALKSARPRVMGALLRYFRALEPAEEAFQEACLAALRRWPEQGPPRDPAAWLIMVGRNSGIDRARRCAKLTDLPDEAELSDRGDAEGALAERLDEAHYRDDILRLLFVCCHPELQGVQQIALALRIICGLSVKQIARAFLVSEAAMEQRITRAKARIEELGIPYEVPDARERAGRLASVSQAVYLLFNEGYSATGAESPIRAPLCEEAIRIARLLLRLFQSEPSVMGLLALLLLQHSRAAARLDAEGEVVLLEAQDRTLWDRGAIEEGLALLDKALRHRAPDPYQVQAAIAALHARAAQPADTDWAQIELLYGTLERLSPSPVVSLNRAVATWKRSGPRPALAAIAPLAAKLSGYFYFHGVRGALLLELGEHDAAREAFSRAIALANTTAEASHIRRQLDALEAAVRDQPHRDP
jgi:RNA polymerase sigma-70 factor, ECF subfamily